MNLPVFYETVPVGVITPGETGPFFVYDGSWVARSNVFPISLSMPIRPEAYGPGVLMPWLTNLLPEGDALQSIGSMIGASVSDVVGLLQNIGLDTAGALSFGEPATGGAPAYRSIPNEAALERIINELPSKPFLLGEDGVSMSLAGTQQKLPVHFMGGNFFIPINGAPSTHILKPDNERLYGSVQNEALCLVLADRIGLKAAEVTTGKAGKRTYLLVTRYDRVFHGGRWARLHQEDFCQALGRNPVAKYEHNGTGRKGVRLQDLFALTRARTHAGDTLRLLRATILNVLLTNVDAHAKNYSLLLTGRGASLAPLYDLMCGSAWEGITQNMAQLIGGQSRGSHVKARHWSRMASECGLSEAGVLKGVEALAGSVLAEIDHAVEEVKAMPAGDHPMLSVFAQEIVRRCRTVLANLDDGDDDDRQDKESGHDPGSAPAS